MLELKSPLTLSALGAALLIFQALFLYDVYIDLTDRQHFLYVSQAKSFTLSVREGGSMAEQMFTTGKGTFTRATRDTTLYDFPYIARAIPITQEGQSVATMSLAMNVDDMDTWKSYQANLSTT